MNDHDIFLALAEVRKEAVALADAVRQHIPRVSGAQPAKRPARVSFWAQYDLIHSDLPTAAKAIEQVLGFLEMRCD